MILDSFYYITVDIETPGKEAVITSNSVLIAEFCHFQNGAANPQMC